CLLALAAFAHAAAAGWSWTWLGASVAASAAAMACKENAVVLPVLIVLYDWFFAPADTPAAWRVDVRRRVGFHAACFATWIILAAVIVVQAGKYQEFGATKWSPLTYALTQPGVILHYVRLAILPVGQCFDHSGWPAVDRFAVGQLPAYLAIAAVVGLSLFGTVGRQPWAWLGMFFLGTLAPTSSMMPVEALANEHRMYLPLAAVLAAVVLGAAELVPRLVSRVAPRLLQGRANGERALGRAGLVAAAVAALVFVTLTRARNDVYRSGTAIWVDVLDHDSDNYRALWQLAVKLDWLGNEQDAFAMADRALAGKPTCDVYPDLARAKLSAGDSAAAERRFRLGLERRRAALPDDDRAVLAATGELATALRLAGRVEEAAAVCDAAIDAMRRVLGGDDTITLRAEQFIAEGLAGRGDRAAAEALARASLDRARRTRPAGDPIVVAGAIALARVLGAAGNAAAAEEVVTRSLADLAGLGPSREGDRLVLEDLRAESLEQTGRLDEALAIYTRLAEHYRARRGPDHPETRAIQAKRAAAADRCLHDAAGKPYHDPLSAGDSPSAR
ncbi:MAG: tetratricopeptide repeat protein, partial [Planctomycetia bacterium]